MQERISLKSLQAILGNNIDKRRVKSDAILPAPSNKLLHGQMLSDPSESARIRGFISDSKLPIVLRAVMELQFLHGLRISETLNIGPSDITKNGRIRIKGLKGSHDRFIMASIHMDFWLSTGVHLLPLYKCYSRFWFYREYKKLLIGSCFGNSQVHSVTHYFRHAVALDSQETFDNINDTKMVLGHKNVKSTEKYVKRRNLQC
jgi:integrase